MALSLEPFISEELNTEDCWLNQLWGSEATEKFYSGIYLVNHFGENAPELSQVYEALVDKYPKGPHQLSVEGVRDELLPLTHMKEAEIWRRDAAKVLTDRQWLAFCQRSLPAGDNYCDETLAPLLQALLQGGKFHSYRTEDLLELAESVLPTLLNYITQAQQRYAKDEAKIPFILRRNYQKWLNDFSANLAEIQNAIAWALLLKLETGYQRQEFANDDSLVLAAERLQAFGLLSDALPEVLSQKPMPGPAQQRRQMTPAAYARAVVWLNQQPDAQIQARLQQLPVFSDQDWLILPNGALQQNFLPTRQLVVAGQTLPVPAPLEKFVSSRYLLPQSRRWRTAFMQKQLPLMVLLKQPIPEIFEQEKILDTTHPRYQGLQARRLLLEQSLADLDQQIADFRGSWLKRWRYAETLICLAHYRELLVEKLSVSRRTEWQFLSTVAQQQARSASSLTPATVNALADKLQAVHDTLDWLAEKARFEQQPEWRQQLLELRALTEVLEPLAAEINAERVLAGSLTEEQAKVSVISQHAQRLLQGLGSHSALDAAAYAMLRELANGQISSAAALLPALALYAQQVALDRVLGANPERRKQVLIAMKSLESEMQALSDIQQRQQQALRTWQENCARTVLVGYLPGALSGCLELWRQGRVTVCDKSTLLNAMQKTLQELQTSAETAIDTIEKRQQSLEKGVIACQHAWQALGHCLDDAVYGQLLATIAKDNPGVAACLDDPTPAYAQMHQGLASISQAMQKQVLARQQQRQQRLQLKAAARQLSDSQKRYPARDNTAHQAAEMRSQNRTLQALAGLPKALLPELALRLSRVTDTVAVTLARLNPENGFYQAWYARLVVREQANLPDISQANAEILQAIASELPKHLAMLRQVVEPGQQDLPAITAEILRMGEYLRQSGNAEQQQWLDQRLDELLWNYIKRWATWDRRQPSLRVQHQLSHYQEQVILALSGDAKQVVLKAHFKKRKSLLDVLSIEKDWLEPCWELSQALFTRRQKALNDALVLAEEQCFAVIRQASGCLHDGEFRKLCDQMVNLGITQLTDPTLKLDLTMHLMLGLSGQKQKKPASFSLWPKNHAFFSLCAKAELTPEQENLREAITLIVKFRQSRQALSGHEDLSQIEAEEKNFLSMNEKAEKLYAWPAGRQLTSGLKIAATDKSDKAKHIRTMHG